jgi:tRNA pseudouridine38-40 synthase
MRIAVGLEYCGTPFSGWQSQRDGCGVQDALERVLATIADTKIRTIAAGRTDAGVHATMQVAHFDVDVSRPETAWVRGVNAQLPREVAVLWAQPVSDDFHARNTATGRYYTYVLANRPARPALLAGRIGWYHLPLDIPLMTAAAGALVGTHDFSAFRAALCQAKSPIKTLSEITITTHAGHIRFDFRADAYLHHMIRNIVGSLVYVGAGKHPPAWIGELLASRERTRAAPTFSPDGLYFTGADYDARWGLPPTRRPITLPLA